MPKVTVLMAVYNGEAFISEAIESILNQSFADFEYLIIDDGSTDGSQAIIDSYVACDSRIRFVSNPANIGLTKSLNKGIDLASGQYLARMDADDVSLPERLSKQVCLLDSAPSVTFTSVKLVEMDEHGTVIGHWDDDYNTTSFEDIYRLLPRRNCIVHPGVMIRTDVLRQFRYNERLNVSQDYDLWLRLCASGHRIEKVDAVLLRYRVTAGSITTRTTEKRFWRNQAVVKRKYLGWAFATGHFGRFTAMAALSFVYVLLKLTITECSGIIGRMGLRTIITRALISS